MKRYVNKSEPIKDYFTIKCIVVDAIFENSDSGAIPVSVDKINKMAEFGSHYENMPMPYSAIFHGCKNDNFQMKN